MNSVFIIAEAGVNHNGSLKLAKELIRAAKSAKVDAIKFQTFRVDDLVCLNTPKAQYQYSQDKPNQTQYEMLKELELTESEQINLFCYAQEKNIQFLSSPFDLKSLYFLNQQLNVPMIKIPSGEITNFPLLFKTGQTNKPVILSTGMSTLGEIEIALGILAYGYLHPNQNSYPSLLECQQQYFSSAGQEILKNNVSLLHCTSAYPTPLTEVNLAAMHTLECTFNLTIGYSDHTYGTAIALAAVARGAKIIEKHFTLDKKLEGPDHKASLDPNELAFLVHSIREIEMAIGDGRKVPSPSELVNRNIARKSIVSSENITQGDFFSEQNITCKRPAFGLSPTYYPSLLKKVARRNYSKDEIIEE